MGEMTNAYKILTRKPLGRLGERMILKWMLGK
jgi:hypothetical protein